MAAPRLMLTKQLDWHPSQMSAADTGGRFVQFSGNQKAVCAKSSGRVVQFVNEGAIDLASRCDGRSIHLQRMDEIADEVTGRHWVAGDMVLMDEGANDLALRCDGWSTLQRMDEMAHEMTEILHVKTLSNI
jgi:hypothetical protein